MPHPASSSRPTPTTARSYDASHASDTEKQISLQDPRKHTELISSSSSDEENEPLSPKPEITPPKKSYHLQSKVRSSQIADLEEVPHGIQRQALKLEGLSFPTHRLATTLTDDSKHPLVVLLVDHFLQ